jgi:hypothetical protein
MMKIKIEARFKTQGDLIKFSNQLSELLSQLQEIPEMELVFKCD